MHSIIFKKPRNQNVKMILLVRSKSQLIKIQFIPNFRTLKTSMVQVLKFYLWFIGIQGKFRYVLKRQKSAGHNYEKIIFSPCLIQKLLRREYGIFHYGIWVQTSVVTYNISLTKSIVSSWN